MHGERDDPVVDPVTLRKAGLGELSVAADRVVVDRDIVHLDSDSSTSQRVKDRRPILDLDHEQVVPMARADRR